MRCFGEQIALIKKYFLDRPTLRPCCILDVWKSAAGDHYVGIVVNFIDDEWNSWAITLAVRPLTVSHTAENVKSIVTDVLAEFAINPQCYVADNAANQVRANDLLADWSNEMAEVMANAPNENAICNDEDDDDDDDVDVFPDAAVLESVRQAFLIPTEAMGCHCHHLELAISHALDEAKSDIDQLCAFANHTRNNDQTRRLLLRFNNDGEVKGVRLPRPATTRWSSVYHLLNKFLECVPIYERVIAFLRTPEGGASHDLPGVAVLEGDLMNARRLRFYRGLKRLLEPVADALNILQADSYPTLPMVQLLGHILHLNCENLLRELSLDITSSRTLKGVAVELRKQLRERFMYEKMPLDDGYVPVDYVAAALDPRTKSLSFLELDEHLFVWSEVTRLALLTLPNEEEEADVNQQDQQPGHILSTLLRQRSKQITPEQSVRSEMLRYQQEPELDLTGDSLAWWRSHEGSYPTVAKIARVFKPFVDDIVYLI